MKKCLVPFCKNVQGMPGVRFFRLTSSRRYLWLLALGRNPDDEISKENIICSVHFGKEDFVNNKLSVNAIPRFHLRPPRPGFTKRFESEMENVVPSTMTDDTPQPKAIFNKYSLHKLKEMLRLYPQTNVKVELQEETEPSTTDATETQPTYVPLSVEPKSEPSIDSVYRLISCAEPTPVALISVKTTDSTVSDIKELLHATNSETNQDSSLPQLTCRTTAFSSTKEKGIGKVNIKKASQKSSTRKPVHCRLCFTVSKLKSVAALPLAEKFNNFSFIEAPIGYKLPKRVCEECLTKLNDLASFIKMCKNSLSKVAHQKRNSQSNIDENNSTAKAMIGEPNDLQESTEMCKSVETTNANESDTTANQLQNSNEAECSIQDDLISPEPPENKLNVSNTLLEHSYFKTGNMKPCPSCGTQVSTLTNHYKEHRSCRPRYIKCPICQMIFKDRSKLQTHQMISHAVSVTPFMCHICSKTFKYSGSLNRHIRIHQRGKRFVCDQCGKRYTTALQLGDHKNKHLNLRPYLCAVCGKQFACKSNLFIHERVHKSNSQESQSQQQSATPRTLRGPNKVNQDGKRTENEPIPCEICGRCFLGYGLKLHMHAHIENRVYNCKKCNEQFETKALYSQHLRKHTIKTASCPQCFKMFTRNTLHMHIKSHTEERPFPCPECGTKFRRKIHLISHRSLLHNVNRGDPWKCKYCDKSFSLKGNLRAHERLHTGETPYACHVCNESFIDTKKRKNHIVQVHGQDEIQNII